MPSSMTESRVNSLGSSIGAGTEVNAASAEPSSEMLPLLLPFGGALVQISEKPPVAVTVVLQVIASSAVSAAVDGGVYFTITVQLPLPESSLVEPAMQVPPVIAKSDAFVPPIVSALKRALRPVVPRALKFSVIVVVTGVPTTGDWNKYASSMDVIPTTAGTPAHRGDATDKAAIVARQHKR